MSRVILLDAGTGNLRSVHKALQTLGGDVTLTDDPGAVPGADKVILPGVGAFGDFMAGMRARGLEAPVRDFAASGRLILGICVGMQAFFNESEEMGRHPGLGLLPGKVVLFPDIAPLKVPHTGWNELCPRVATPLLRGLEHGAYAYFNHSYYCAPADPGTVAADTEYGICYASVVQKGNVCGVQFHPEKSQKVGLAILDNFLRM